MKGTVFRPASVSVWLFAFFFTGVFFAGVAVHAENRFLREGIEQYNLENYEESAPLFEKAREMEPESCVAAFFSGMAYKHMLLYENAVRGLRDAASCETPIREALAELIDALNRTGEFAEAEKWIGVAEKERVEPAKIAFLKGETMSRTGRYDEAVESYGEAGRLDPSLSQLADIRAALVLIRTKRHREARARLEAAILYDPDSNMAEFARHYMGMTESRIDMKPLHMAVGVFGQYDSNVVLKPDDSDFGSDITDEASTALATRFRLDYCPDLEGPWLFNAHYSFAGNFYDHNSDTHDFLANDIYLAPGYDFGKIAAYWIGRYMHSLVRDPSYKEYSETFETGPMFRTVLRREHIFEILPSYKRRIFHRPVLMDEEDRDADVWSGSASWIWLFQKDAFVSLRYEYENENAEGDNWDSDGHRLTLNSSLPVAEKLALNFGGELFLQDFDNTNSVFLKKREDDSYRLFAGLSWEFWKSVFLIVDYVWTRVDSNVAAYDYNRYVLSAGMEYRY